MQRSRFLRGAASMAAVLAAFPLAGCGGGGSVPSPAPAPAPEPAPAPPASTLRTFAYVASADFGNISVFQVREDGELSPVQEVDVNAAGRAGMIAFHPSGKFAYASEYLSGAIHSFAVDPGTGTLRAIGAAQSVDSIYRIFVHPSGKFAYTTSPARDQISRFTIDTNTGLLRPEETLDVGRLPFSLSFDASGKFLFLGAADVISTFSINADTGALTLIDDVSAGLMPLAISLFPNGKYIAVAWADAVISTHAIDPVTGILGDSVSLVETGDSTYSIAIDPSGKFLFAANVDSDGITRYAVAPDTGVLEELLPRLSSLPGPLSLSFNPSGRFMHVTNRTASTVSTYELDHGTGALNPSGNDVAVPRNPAEITVVRLLG